ncbi:MAG: shikimate dehydrogenase [Clostridia bacterium]
MVNRCYRSELVGLLGTPVDENPTVVPMEAAFRALGLDYRYVTMEVKPENLAIAIHSLKALGFKGTNLTIPHKVEVLKYLDHIAPDAQVMGAVNTVYIKDGETYGENTDGKGFLKTLNDANVSMNGKTAVVLGAGGAARAITVELANAGITHITVVNVNPERGNALVDLLNEKTAARANYVLWDHIYQIPDKTDLLIQATSIGLYPDLSCPNIDYDTLPQGLVVCDIVPNPPETGFVKRARSKGCQTFVGLDMLVNQGVISFKMWTGIDAPADVMKEALSKEFFDNSSGSLV